MAVRKELAKMLVSSGWAKVDGVLRCNVDSEWSLLVALGPLGNQKDVSPVVAIRSESIEILLSELMDLSDYPYVATLGSNVGYVLGGKFETWRDSERSLKYIYENIMSGLAVLRPYASLVGVIDAFEVIRAAKAAPSARYVLVVVELLRGNRNEVSARMLDAQAEYCRRDDEVCEEFRAFEKRARLRFPHLF